MTVAPGRAIPGREAPVEEFRDTRRADTKAMRTAVAIAGMVAVMGGATTPGGAQQAPAAVEWTIDNLTSIGGHAVRVVGTPRVVETEVGRALEFNGSSDGIIVAANPIEGLTQFTIEVLFSPAPDGPPEQRFLHIEDTGEGGNRALIETRMLGDGRWCLDTFLKNGPASLALIDRAQTHPAAHWYVASLAYDGRGMSHYVNGVRELSGNVTFGPLAKGQTSLGVRQNLVYWFKGRIRTLRVTPKALDAGALMQVHATSSGVPRGGA